MPIYEYRCSKCGKTFEKIRKFSDAPLTIHEECGGPVEQLLSAPAFHLKGQGWYATDYTKKAKTGENGDGKPEAKQETKPEGKPERPSDSKVDAKPAAPAPKPDSQPSNATKAD